MSERASSFEAWFTDNEPDESIVPAATVVVVRDGNDGVETLMLRKNSKLAFGGMWVFPGGRIVLSGPLLDELAITPRNLDGTPMS